MFDRIIALVEVIALYGVACFSALVMLSSDTNWMARSLFLVGFVFSISGITWILRQEDI